MATKVIQGKGIPSPNSINGCNGEKDICDMILKTKEFFKVIALKRMQKLGET